MKNRWTRANVAVCTGDENRLIPQGEAGGKIGKMGVFELIHESFPTDSYAFRHSE